MLLAFCIALSFSQFAFAKFEGGAGDGHAMGISPSDQSLPVQLSTFTATVSGGDVILKWVTQSEVNNLGFQIYRSEAKDGNYTKIDFVSGAGSTAMPTDYQFTDKEVESRKTYFYYLEDVDIAGEKSKSDIVEVVVTPSKKLKIVVPPAELVKPIPKEFRLLQSFPNPFNPDTWIPYQLPCDAEVTIRIYNVFGQLINTLSLGEKEAGYYITKDESAYWDGKNSAGESVASGVYLYAIQAGEFSATRRMVILK